MHEYRISRRLPFNFAVTLKLLEKMTCRQEAYISLNFSKET